MRLRPDLRLVAKEIYDGSRVLDLGCGDGELLSWLIDRRSCVGIGVERDPDTVLQAMSRGIPVMDIDIDHDMEMIPDDTFDVVVLSRTLQAVQRPDLLLNQLRRIAPRVIVTMPNFVYWRHRLRFLSGRTPQGGDLPYAWYESPNIRYASLSDLEDMFATLEVDVEKRIPLLVSGKPGPSGFAANLLASSALYVLRRHED